MKKEEEEWNTEEPPPQKSMLSFCSCWSLVLSLMDDIQRVQASLIHSLKLDNYITQTTFLPKEMETLTPSDYEKLKSHQHHRHSFAISSLSSNIASSCAKCDTKFGVLNRPYVYESVPCWEDRTVLVVIVITVPTVFQRIQNWLRNALKEILQIVVPIALSNIWSSQRATSRVVWIHSCPNRLLVRVQTIMMERVVSIHRTTLSWMTMLDWLFLIHLTIRLLIWRMQRPSLHTEATVMSVVNFYFYVYTFMEFCHCSNVIAK